METLKTSRCENEQPMQGAMFQGQTPAALAVAGSVEGLWSAEVFSAVWTGIPWNDVSLRRGH